MPSEVYVDREGNLDSALPVPFRDLRRHALDYARKKGKPIFPLNGKRPITLNGFKAATTDAAIIDEWWTQHPRANIGMPTGAASGCVVLDIDPRNRGDDSLYELETEHGALPDTLEVLTGGGGRHLYFRYPSSGALACVSGLADGIDLKADGGYVVMPPSVHPETRQPYRWEVSSIRPPASLPEWLAALVQSGHRREGRAPALPAVIPQGQRHAMLLSLGGSMRRRGAGEQTILGALVSENARCRPPLAEDELREIARSVARYEPGTLTTVAGQPEQRPTATIVCRTAAEFAALTPEDTEWIAAPWVAAGAITELDGAVKAAGKTTFALALARAAIDGAPFLDQPTVRTPVVYLTEQPDSSFRQALRRAGVLDSRDLHIISWKDTVGIPWPEVCRQAVERCQAVRARLLIVDTLGQFAGLRGDAENDSGHALEALLPLQEASAARGLAVFCGRHDRKGGGAVGESGRGSSAYAGVVDVVMRLHRPEGNVGPNLRVIDSLSRFDGTPPSLVVELVRDSGRDEYVSHGAEADLALRVEEAKILQDLPDDGAEVLAPALLGEHPPGTRSRALKGLLADGRVYRSGQGKKGSPYSYRKAVPTGSNTEDDSLPLQSEFGGNYPSLGAALEGNPEMLLGEAHTSATGIPSKLQA
jgi:hypothetical protein